MPKKRSQERYESATSSTEEPRGARAARVGLPEDVAAIRREISSFFDTKDAAGNKIGNYQYGVYAFYDYDGEPIYIGQTFESLRQRIGRHLTNQRTDAVAMNVLDPFEVAEICVWPLDLSNVPEGERRAYLDRAEYTLFQKVVSESKLGAVLNEKPPLRSKTIQLPSCHRRRIIPDSIYPQRKHPDVRIARRASTIASLARVISERDVSPGLRRTLLTQARRLEKLAAERLEDFPADTNSQ
ncbi:MAG TPA: GIY-YIG nuclease family protein [Verrucomicrobiae bacterium]|nr:GIY-YIG nuclease family protein [Verrucomicrobiae bacterium]